MGKPVRVFNNVAISGAADHISDVVVADDDVALISFHFQWEGDPTGTFALFQSNLPQPGTNPTTKGWVAVPTEEVDFTDKTPAGSAGSSLVNISATSGSKYIVVYTHATGSGILDCYQVSKKPGAAGEIGPPGPTGPPGPATPDTEASVTLIGDTGLHQSTLNRFYDGVLHDDDDIVITSDGAIITFAIEMLGGGNLHVRINQTTHFWDTTPPDTIALTAGTDIAPVENYVFATLVGANMVLGTSLAGFPSGSEFIALAKVFCQSAAGVQADGPYKVHNFSDNLHSTEQGHLSEVNIWIRRQPATWNSGIAAGDMVVDDPDAFLSVAAGVAFQLHSHTFPVIDMEAGDPAFIVNDPTTAFKRITTLDDVTQLADAGAINNRWFSLVLWGSVADQDADSKLYINLPTGSYSTEAQADADANDFTIFAIPDQFTGTGILLAKYVVQGKDSGVWVQGSKIDLRGLTPSASPGASGNIVNHDELSGNAASTAHDKYVLADGTTAMTGDLNHDGANAGFRAVAPVPLSAAYTPTNVTPDRSYDADSTSVAELADILGTLIADLKLQGLVG